MRYLRYAIIVAFSLLFIFFAVANRQVVELSFFPLTYTVAMPLFLYTMLCIVTGVLLAGFLLSFRTARARMLYKSEHKRVMALENELGGIRAEKTLLAAPEAEEKPAKRSLSSRLFGKAA